VLVDGARDAEFLTYRHAGKGRQERDQFGQGSAVPFDPAVGLLEDEAGGERERLVGEKSLGQEAGEDHDALGVDGTTELGLALDVQDAAPSHADPRGNAYRMAKGHLADLADRQAVDLADPGALGVDEKRSASDRLLDAVAEPGLPANLPLHRRDDVSRLDGGGVTGEKIRLAQHVGHSPHVCRHLLGIAGHLRGMVDRFHDRFPRERLQAFAAADRRDQPRVEHRGLVGPLQFVFEIGGDLEQLREFRIVGREQVVEMPLPDQQHLNVERYGLRFQRDRGDEAERLRERLDRDLAGAERPLQLVVGERLHQQLGGIDHQIAAVCAMQRPALDQQEVGRKSTELRHVLDAANQIRVCRIVLVDHRSAGASAIVDQDVDAVAPQGGRLQQRAVDGELCARWERLRHSRRTHQLFRVLDDVGLHRIEMGGDIGQVGMAPAQFGDGMADRVADRLLLEFAYLAAASAAPRSSAGCAPAPPAGSGESPPGRSPRPGARARRRSPSGCGSGRPPSLPLRPAPRREPAPGDPSGPLPGPEGARGTHRSRKRRGCWREARR